MKPVVTLAWLLLMWSAPAAAGDTAACVIGKGLYEGWLGLAKAGSVHAGGGVPVAGAPTDIPAPDRRKAIGKEYQSFFRCLSDSKDEEAVQAQCKDVEGDRVAQLACHTAAYLKGGRMKAKEFLDSLPANRKGAEAIWDLYAIADSGDAPPVFQPGGPAHKLIDELFLLMLDDRETAAAKYMMAATLATGDAARHIDEQMLMLLRESPSVLVKRWMVFRQYQPKFKKLVAELSANPVELQKVRKGIGAFCGKDNPDCPEIVRLFGKSE